MKTLSQNEWIDYIHLYLQNIDVTPLSKKVYAKALNQWIYFLKTVETHSDTTNIFLLYKQHLLARQLSPHTICGYLNVLKSLFRYLEEAKIIEKNPYKNIRIRKPRSTRESIPKSKILKLLALDFTDNIEGLRNRAILNLKIFTGLRDSSIVQADVEDIKIGQDETTPILYYKSKGHDGKDSYVVLNNEVYEAINQYLAKRKQITASSPLFSSLCWRDNTRLSTQTTRRILKQFFDRAEIRGAKPHQIRNSAVTMAILGGASIQDVRDMCSHASPTTTMIYYSSIERLKSPAELCIKKYLMS